MMHGFFVKLGAFWNSYNEGKICASGRGRLDIHQIHHTSLTPGNAGQVATAIPFPAEDGDR